MSTKLHNKSGLEVLSLAKASDSERKVWERTLCNCAKRKHQGLIPGSPCLLLAAKDGRLSVNQKKVCFAYQLVAALKFGYDVVRRIPASKSGDSLMISHLCGTRNCCNPDHIVIETKATNDERTHCHFCMNNVWRLQGEDGLRQFLEIGGVPAHPTVRYAGGGGGGGGRPKKEERNCKSFVGRKLGMSASCTLVNCGKPLKPDLPRPQGDLGCSSRERDPADGKNGRDDSPSYGVAMGNPQPSPLLLPSIYRTGGGRRGRFRDYNQVGGVGRCLLRYSPHPPERALM